MREGSTRKIDIRDSSGAGLSLFLEILYTSSTRSNILWPDVNVALDLAHRWQVPDVVRVLSDLLQDIHGLNNLLGRSFCIHFVVPMISSTVWDDSWGHKRGAKKSCVQDMLTADNLVGTAEAAVLKGLGPLQKSCVSFWSALSDAAKSKVKADGKMPKSVKILFGLLEAGSPDQAQKKRRTF